MTGQGGVTLLLAAPEMVIAGSVVVALMVLAWSDGFHRGWRKARRAEIRRVRERQARTYARQRRSTRL